MTGRFGPEATPDVCLGLRENLTQFALLAVVNLFVGGMVGLERTVIPLVGAHQFHLSELAVASFVIVFGFTKAFTNAAGGMLTRRHTRKTLLIAGWVIAIPVPFMLAYGNAWAWVVGANVFLGINQGLTWSMTVNMKIDLIGPARRGLALGINETAGYLGVGLTALATGYLASAYGLRPDPELLGVAFVAAGLLLSATVIVDTAPWAHTEAAAAPENRPATKPSAWWVTTHVSWKNRTLAGVSQAGLVNNLNDGLTWVILPLLLADHGVGVANIGIVKALYPLVWATGMIGTGHLSDRHGRKPPVVAGMFVQAAGFAVIAVGTSHALVASLIGSLLLGAGTALVYPTLLAAITDATHPTWRADALGVYRFWRDSGYALGALIGGITAAVASLNAAIIAAAVLTALSGLAAGALITETRPSVEVLPA